MLFDDQQKLVDGLMEHRRVWGDYHHSRVVDQLVEECGELLECEVVRKTAKMIEKLKDMKGPGVS